MIVCLGSSCQGPVPGGVSVALGEGTIPYVCTCPCTVVSPLGGDVPTSYFLGFTPTESPIFASLCLYQVGGGRRGSTPFTLVLWGPSLSVVSPGGAVCCSGHLRASCLGAAVLCGQSVVHILGQVGLSSPCWVTPMLKRHQGCLGLGVGVTYVN